MRKFTLLTLLYICSTLLAGAASPMDMRFHCENDTIKINSLLKEGLESNILDGNGLIVFYAKKLLDTPYVAHTLEGEQELLTINIRTRAA